MAVIPECATCWYLPVAEQSGDTEMKTVIAGKAICTQHAASLRSKPVFTEDFLMCAECLFLAPGNRPGTGELLIVYNGEGYCTEHAASIAQAIRVGGVTTGR